MRRSRCRRFSILDGMILVAATAVGLVLARTIFGDAVTLGANVINISRPITYFLLAWTLAVLTIRLRQPHPSLRRLVCQPGMAACLAVATVTAVDATAWAIYWAQLESRHATEMLARYWRGYHERPGLVVAAVWLGLLLSRRWRPEPGWIDRLGRLIGGLWLLTLLFGHQCGRWMFVFLHWVRHAT